MKTIIAFLMLCSVIQAETIKATSEEDKPRAIAEWKKQQRQKAESKANSDAAKLASHTKSLGKVVVKYPEFYGPYVLWQYTDRNGQVTSFEARLVDIKNGLVTVGTDDVPTEKTNLKQMRMFVFPLKGLPFQGQKAAREEIAKRAADKAHKRVRYPEPPAEPEPEVVIVPAKQRAQTGRFTYDPKTKKSTPSDQTVRKN